MKELDNNDREENLRKLERATSDTYCNYEPSHWGVELPMSPTRTRSHDIPLGTIF